MVGFSFKKIKLELEKGRKVLFCGTPCQVAGLSQFLGKTYDNLITCDFACGGLPSHAIYQDYISSLENKYHSTIAKVDFRPKTHGWKRYAVLVSFKNGKVYNRLGVEDEYLKSFLYGKYTVRDYCLDCKFSDCHVSDITIADFWLHNKLSELNNENGISLVLCNSEKGKQMLESVNDSFLFSSLDVSFESNFQYFFNCLYSKELLLNIFWILRRTLLKASVIYLI
jgi:coenzyme F420-reducing hydrogenase beta subunit